MSRASSAACLPAARMPSSAQLRCPRSFSLPQYRSPGSRFQGPRRRPPSTAAAPHPLSSEVVNAYRRFRAAPPAPVAAAAAPGAPSSGISAFNPAISAVLQGVYANLSQDPKQYAINGFVPSGDIAPAKRGFSLAESELALSANVDDKVFG